MSDNDQLIPDPQVWRGLNICSRTLNRWTQDPSMGFPPAIRIRNRNYRSRAAIEAWKETMLRKGIRVAMKDDGLEGEVA